MKRVVIMFGAPGAGKGTQAVRLSRELSLPHVSTGDLFRDHLAQGTELGAQVKAYMDAGNLVPDELVIEMLFERVAAEDCANGFLLDGFPRTLPQAEVLEARLGEVDLLVIDLEVDDEAIVERITGRLLCRGCENIQHATFAPPATPGVCDTCRGELYQRDDDRPEVVRKRLAVYHEQTQPVVSFYSERSALCAVDGSQTPDEVFASCLACLQEAR